MHSESDMGRYGPIHSESDDLVIIFFNMKNSCVILIHLAFSNLSCTVGIFSLIVLVCKGTEDLILKFSGTQGIRISIHNLPDFFLILRIPGDCKISLFFCHIM